MELELLSEENVFRPQFVLVPFRNFQRIHVRRYNEAKGEATSGEYWLYSTTTGKTVLVSCNMERKGDKTEVFFVLVIDVDVKILILVIYR